VHPSSVADTDIVGGGLTGYGLALASRLGGFDVPSVTLALSLFNPVGLGNITGGIS